MKKFRKLIPAFVLLLISTAIMSSATFAWFSMNTAVTATDMTITAKTDNAYLVIKQGTSIDTSSDRLLTASATPSSAVLYPVKPAVALTSANIETIETWGVGHSDDPDDANTSSAVTPLTSSATFGDYVYKTSFMVGIVPNSGDATHDLKLSTVTLSNATAGITVVVKCGENVFTHNADVASGSEVLATAAALNAAGTTGLRIDVYLYIDGSDANVYTSNIANLTGDVELEFSIGA